MDLKESCSVEIYAVAPYSFELTLHKPAGWWWSSPDEYFKDDTFWSVTRFNNQLLGLKLLFTGTIQKPQIHCTIYSKNKIDTRRKAAYTAYA